MPLRHLNCQDIAKLGVTTETPWDFVELQSSHKNPWLMSRDKVKYISRHYALQYSYRQPLFKLKAFMNEVNTEPNDDWFFHNPLYFPWDIVGLDRPMIGPVHSYIASICARYERDQGIKSYLSGSPHWGSIERFATEGAQEDRHPVIVAIYQYCSSLYKKSNSDRRNTEFEVLGFLEGVQDFRVEFRNQLLYLYGQGRLNLKPAMLRRKRTVY